MRNENYYLILAGGVGAAKFVEGVAHVLDPSCLKIIVNTGDDIELFGLQICPDLDIITYTLASLVDEEKGWGLKDESFSCLSMLKKYYDFDWFNMGDKDLATHIFRTDLINRGFTKTQVTEVICQKLGISAEILPMCDQKVETYISTSQKEMHFEEYYIKYQCQPEIIDIEFKGIDESLISKDIIKYIKEANKIIICPSNPIVSIGTILKVKGMKEALKRVKNKSYAVSPIIQGQTVKGPADKLMRFKGLNVSCVGVAEFYREFIGHMVIDIKDRDLKPKIEDLGLKAYCFDTMMVNLEKKRELANFIIDL
ncbi:MAG: 2-phospho-L-lactate transferase [Candidatus Lokiarchaeota archaeon]|nr:2-phospho-L-lactate transferase [Candidatus Lokiarchaeota archaeon]MBD3339295.1 2-phospho-L-lactate transferase [Candidatus Lokiarchaeota archaeon]